MFTVFNKVTKLTMQSIKTKVEENQPNNRNFLLDFVKKKEEVINAEQDDYENEKMFEKAKELCEYDVAKFKKSVLPGFKYNLELLKDNDPKGRSYRSICRLSPMFLKKDDRPFV